MSDKDEFAKLKDQLVLWLLLIKLKELGFKTQRLKLQKLVYLMDVFGTILSKKPTTYTFRVYKFGPFSKEIYTDIERLVSIDLVKAKAIEELEPERDRSFEYEIECEKQSNSRSELLLARPEFDVIRKTVDLVVETTGYLSGAEIRKLVYSEPNYIKAKMEGFGSIINPHYSFATHFREMSKRISCEEFGIALKDEEVLWLYLNFLRSMESMKGQLVIE